MKTLRKLRKGSKILATDLQYTKNPRSSGSVLEQRIIKLNCLADAAIYTDNKVGLGDLVNHGNDFYRIKQ